MIENRWFIYQLSTIHFKKKSFGQAGIRTRDFWVTFKLIQATGKIGCISTAITFMNIQLAKVFIDNK